MRHAAAFCNQFPVTAHIASLILYNQVGNARMLKVLPNGKMLELLPVHKSLCFPPACFGLAKIIAVFQVNHYFRTAFLYIRNDEII